MRFYVGPQVGLGEFEDVDFSISWLETPLFLSKFTVIGNGNLAVVYKGSEEIGKVSDFQIFDLEVPFLVAVGNDTTYPELFHKAKELGASFSVVYSTASDMAELMMFKYRNWAHAQEAEMIVIGLVEVFNKVHHGIYVPTRFKGDSGIIHEGVTPAFVELEVMRVD